MEGAIRGYLREQGMRGNIALATLLDELDVNSLQQLAEEVEDAMQRLGLSSSTRVDTLLRLVSEEETAEPMEVETESVIDGEGGDDESDEEQDGE